MHNYKSIVKFVKYIPVRGDGGGIQLPEGNGGYIEWEGYSGFTGHTWNGGGAVGIQADGGLTTCPPPNDGGHTMPPGVG